MNKRTLILSIIFLLFGVDNAIGQFYQGSIQEFGKNRVQYNSFGWKSHNYKRFKIYYSGINEDIANYTAQTMHHYLEMAEVRLDYTIPEKLEVIVYQSQSKFRQSNLGLTNDEQSNVGGTTRIIGSKIFVFYEGDHQQFNDNIKSAVYEVLLKHLFFGGDWKDQLKSSVSSGIPTWLEEGLVRYFVHEWNSETESRVKDLILTKKIDKFNNLNEQEKSYAGHALWNYIAETHGPTIIPNILYVTRISKNVERGFFSLMGMDFPTITRNYISFYRSRYIKEYERQNEPDGDNVNYKIKKESDYYGAKLSPDGRSIAYVENQLGRYRVKIYNSDTKKTKKLFAAEPKMDRLQDHTYPVIGWHPSGQALAFFSELKGELLLFIYDLENETMVRKPMKNLDKILDFSYSNDGKKIIFSGVVKGQADLYLYEVLGGNTTQITDDIYDDLNPRFLEDDKKVIFASNRDNDTIFKKPAIKFIDRKNDIFIYDLSQINHTYKYLDRITNTPDENEIQPYALNEGGYIYLSDKNGIYNRFIAAKDSVIAFIDTTIHYRHFVTTSPQTNYVTSINEHHINENMEMVYGVYQNGENKFFTTQADTSTISDLWNTTYIEKRVRKKAKAQKREEIKNDTVQVGNHLYQKEIVYIGGNIKTENTEDSDTDSLITKKIQDFEPPKYQVYKINFAKDFILSQFDNNFLFQNYQPYSGPGSVYFNPGINAILKVGASDLFDDFKLLGGVRIPARISSGGEFMFMLQHLKNRVDHRLILYRQKMVVESGFYRLLTHDIRYRMNFPISETWSFRSTINLRRDNRVDIPVSDISLTIDPVARYNSGLNLELVLDNTIPMELNIRRGTRFKVFAEYLQELGGNYDPTFNLGMDLRHYTRIKRNFIWVNRLAGATSLGGRKLLYYMGAVDSWVLRPNTDFDNSIQVDPSQNYAFQTIATPMRGFIQNARNGNSFVVFNSELRLPIISYFSSYPIKSEFLRHFQIVGFTDVGTAWTGPHPFSPENYFNTQIINDKPVTINVQNLREPIIGGLGFGLRSKIWGYFVRLDVAWGIENLEFQKPQPYISLTKDI
ncbi:TolB-like translocation protein [Crocinitomix algicola]|uniref:PD40 domain-containing protein n=1 Tax=Crocinitomix algicola TaxID=1740263 RepID=UPI000872FAB5|nr:PD40 domain-containing protein [Crocinitomix algicola]